MIQAILITLGLILLGWCLAEVFKSFSGRSENITDDNPRYFSFIGIVVTQKDVQRLVLAVILGVIAMALMKNFSIIEDFDIYGFKVNGEILRKSLYVIIGFAPSTVMAFIKQKVQKKMGVKNSNKTPLSSGGHSSPRHEEH